jgi:hypothetical protein
LTKETDRYEQQLRYPAEDAQYEQQKTSHLGFEQLFDLRVGRIILVAPQKAGAVRFYQTDIPPSNSAERDKYIENLKSDKKAIDFFADQGNI